MWIRPLLRASAVMIVLLLGMAPAASAAPHRVTNDVKNFKSRATKDGYVTELSETANAGGFLNVDSPVVYVGDTDLDRQVRSILVFNTAGIPDNASVTKAILKLKWAYTPGSGLFGDLGDIRVYVGKFGASSNLELVDWESPPQLHAGTISNNPVDAWYKATFFNQAEPYIKLNGLTQIRLQAEVQDNDNNAMDGMSFHSGDSLTKSLRPSLRVEYTVP